MHFVEKSKNFNKNEMGSKMENHTVFREMDLVLQLIQESQIKCKPVMNWSLGKKKRGPFLPFILSQGNFFNIVALSQCIVY